MRISNLLCATVLVAGTVAGVACGARTELELPVPPLVGGMGGSGGDAPGGGGFGGAPECVVYNSSAELAPLDVFIMLDASGSMEFPTGNTTKWFAVREALSAFANDSASEGIGVALSFFPIIDPSVPEQCTSSVDCGAPDMCQFFGYCPSIGITCQEDEDCATNGAPQDSCEPLGICQNSPNQFCFPNEPNGGCSVQGGPCVDVGVCENHFTCTPGPYAQTVFGVGELPGAANGLIAAFDTKVPDGATPTLPALTGAAQAARSYAQANPTHTVVVVLTTDGLPTVCDPALNGEQPQIAIENLANVAADAASDGVQVWALGIFSPDEEAQAQANLDTIAQAGGTEKAFVVTTESNVTEEFVEALNIVRIGSKACEFGLAPSEEPVDYDQVWVRISPKDAPPVWVPRVDGVDACDPDVGGFYYDVDPNEGQPSKVILCEASCGLLGNSPEERVVEIFTTCPDDPTDP